MKRRILRLTALILALLLTAVPLSSCHPASDGAGETELPEILVGSDEYEPFFTPAKATVLPALTWSWLPRRSGAWGIGQNLSRSSGREKTCF